MKILDEKVVRTVLGPIEPSQLGVTLTHEHLLINEVPVYFQAPEQATQRMFAYQPVSLENLSWVRFNQLSNADNIKMDDENLLADEMLKFKHAGGRTIVDVTSVGLARDPKASRDFRYVGNQHHRRFWLLCRRIYPYNLDSKDVDDIKNEIFETAGSPYRIPVSEQVSLENWELPSHGDQMNRRPFVALRGLNWRLALPWKYIRAEAVSTRE